MRFFAGFLTASVIWAGAFYAYYAGWVGAEPEPEASTDLAVAAPADDDGADKPRKRRRFGRRGAGDPRATGRAGTVEDQDIGWDDGQELDMAGGEEQLKGSQIEAGFDSVMQRIRRCLVLVPSDDEVTGQLTFGMRVGSDGKPKAVSLSGPSIVTSGESGDCLRTTAQGIQFAAFNGPDAVFKYPVTLR